MANNNLQKQKILLIFEYFLKYVSPNDSLGVTMKDINAFLAAHTNSVGFERKSISSDISRVNEFVSEMFGVKHIGEDDSWIYCEGKRYKRRELINEISYDEACLIIDAISSTPFVRTSLKDKIIEMFPVYKLNLYTSLCSSENAVSKYPAGNKLTQYMSCIRSAISDKSVVSIYYGQKLAGAVVDTKRHVLSPIAMEWKNNNYYLIAIDNEFYNAFVAKREYVEEECSKRSLRRYRVDRIASVSVEQKGHKYVTCDNRHVEEYIQGSTNAYFDVEGIEENIYFELISDNSNTLLSAFDVFQEHVTVKSILHDAHNNGRISFLVRASITPTLCSEVLRLYTFNSANTTLDIVIDNKDGGEKLKKMLRNYLKLGIKSCDGLESNE